MDELNFEVSSCNTVTSTTRTNSTIQDEEEDGEEEMYVTKQNNGGWFCSACNCEIFQDKLNQHFSYHTVFMFPITDENELNDDNEEDNLIFDEIGKKLGEVLATFSEKRKSPKKDSIDEVKPQNDQKDKCITAMMDLHISEDDDDDEETGEAQSNLKNDVNEKPSEMEVCGDDDIPLNISPGYKTKQIKDVASSKGHKTDIESFRLLENKEEEKRKMKKKKKREKEKKESTSDEEEDVNNNKNKEKTDFRNTEKVNNSPDTSSNPQKSHHKHHKHHRHHSGEKEEKKKERNKSGDSTSEEHSKNKGLALKSVFTKNKLKKNTLNEDRKFINDSDSDYEKRKKKKSSDSVKLKIKSSTSSPKTTTTTPKTTEKRKLKIGYETDEEIITPKKSKEGKHHSKVVALVDSLEKHQHHSVKSSKEKNDSTKQLVPKKTYQYLVNAKNKYKSPMIQVHIESMMAEMDKENPSVSKLHELMNATFKYRKYEFELYEDPIPNSLRDFPALKHWSIVKAEFDKIKNDKNVTFSKLESKLTDKLVRYQANFELQNYLIPDKLLQKAREDYKRNENNRELLRDIQILCLAFKKTNSNWNLNGTLFKQRVKGERPFVEVTPCIDCRGELSSSSKRISVYCERREITRAPNMFEAIMCCYALYWIYNLCYETNAEPIYNYFDQLLMRKE